MGATYIFYLTAFNINGETVSETSAFVIASIPTAPTSAPSSDLLVSSDSLLKISYPAIAVSDNGGSPILSYSLEIDDGQGGKMVSLYGEDIDTMSLSFIYRNVTRSLLY